MFYASTGSNALPWSPESGQNSKISAAVPILEKELWCVTFLVVLHLLNPIVACKPNWLATYWNVIYLRIPAWNPYSHYGSHGPVQSGSEAIFSGPRTRPRSGSGWGPEPRTSLGSGPVRVQLRSFPMPNQVQTRTSHTRHTCHMTCDMWHFLRTLPIRPGTFWHTHAHPPAVSSTLLPSSPLPLCLKVSFWKCGGYIVICICRI